MYDFGLDFVLCRFEPLMPLTGETLCIILANCLEQESSSSEVGSAAQDIEAQIKTREDPNLVGWFAI